MKPGPNYRMSAQAKRFAATIIDAHQRGAYKRAMIDAELTAAMPAKREPRDKGGRPGANYQTNPTGTASTQV
jgi:hypothetical protein